MLEAIVTKRDGRPVDFDKSKIVNAVLKAFKEIDGDISDEAKMIATDIGGYVEGVISEHLLGVEQIQDIVEDKLMESDRKDVAKAYVRYRYERTKARERNSVLMKNVWEKIQASNVQNQNANVDEKSFGGRKGEADSEIMRKIALDMIVSDMARNHHINNEIYIHDLDSYAVGMHNCLSIPFDDLLSNGFYVRQTDIRPANSVGTAFQLVAVIFQLQSLQQFGGVSATHLDWTMVPYVRKSFYKHYCDGLKYVSKKDYYYIPGSIGDCKVEKNKWKQMSDFMCKHFNINDRYGYSDDAAYEYAMDMTRKEVYQAVEAMYHNLNY